MLTRADVRHMEAALEEEYGPIKPYRRREQKPGYVYAIKDQQGRVKIGHANDPIRRLAQNQIGNADELLLIGCIPGSRKREREIHELLAADRIRGEWYWETDDLLDLFSRRPETRT